jgi:inward rectifier potassium channel
MSEVIRPDDTIRADFFTLVPVMRAKKSVFQKYGQQNVEIGFGQKYAEGSKRLVNKDGSFNIQRVNTLRSRYVDLIQMSWKKFLLYIFIFYSVINLVFGTIYFFIGPEKIHVNNDHAIWYQYMECISFSVQTLATVGYGVLNPDSFSTNVLSSVEALLGVLIFAIMTGICYTRFSKPTGGYKFSEKVLVSPYQNINSIQLRVANHRKSNIVEVEATLMLSMEVDDNGVNKRLFLNLPLERNKIYYLPLSWTIVHPITTDSPLYNKTAEDLQVGNAELILMVKAHDDAYAQTVHGVTSYTYEEFVWGAKFESSYYTGKNGVAVFEIDKLGDYNSAELNKVEHITESAQS